MSAEMPSLARSSLAARQAAKRLAEFRRLRDRGALSGEVAERLASEAAEAFLTSFQTRGEYLADAIALLTEIATLDEPLLSEPGWQAAFPLLIERLSDSFDPVLCHLYDRVFAQMVSHCRRLPAGARLDAMLRRFGLHTAEDLLARRDGLRRRTPGHHPQQQRRVRKVLALSRVTLGADVAITSVLLAQARNLFPEARRVLLGPAKARELFGGDASLDLREVPYPTGGPLLERLESWVGVVAAVEEELRGLPPSEYLLLDPDSRYLQLGMLPALQEESRYYFFESRVAGANGSESLSQLAARWLKEQFGGEEDARPHIALRAADKELGRRMRQRLIAGGARWIVAASFGVGGNASKRLPEPFEEAVLARLIEDGCTVVLDQGAGAEEAARGQALAQCLRRRGVMVCELDAEKPDATHNSPLPCALLIWRSGIGPWAGLIASCDEYLGYDSAGQHIAAALGVPTISVFSANSTPRFRHRWRPAGAGIVRVITEPERSAGTDTAAAALALTLAAHRELRSALCAG